MSIICQGPIRERSGTQHPERVVHLVDRVHGDRGTVHAGRERAFRDIDELSVAAWILHHQRFAPRALG